MRKNLSASVLLLGLALGGAGNRIACDSNGGGGQLGDGECAPTAPWKDGNYTVVRIRCWDGPGVLEATWKCNGILKEAAQPFQSTYSGTISCQGGSIVGLKVTP